MKHFCNDEHVLRIKEEASGSRNCIFVKRKKSLGEIVRLFFLLPDFLIVRFRLGKLI